jgi:REP element-mobilizing transposase RayT
VLGLHERYKIRVPEGRHSVGHSYCNVLIYIVFSTKNRTKSIPHDGQEELWRYMTGIAKNLDVNVLAIGGMPDRIIC